MNIIRGPLPFQPFDEWAPVRVYHHLLLPHWRQEGGTYFVTFRLADSVPQTVLDQWADEIEWEKRGASLAGTNQSRDQDAVRSMIKRLHAYLDQGRGSCLLQDPGNAAVVADALEHFHGSRVWTGDYVVMPNHVHALLTPFPGHELEGILHSIKSFTAMALNRRMSRSGTLWQRDSYDHLVRDSVSLHRIQEYIRNNPAKAGLRPGTYRLSEADYVGVASSRPPT